MGQTDPRTGRTPARLAFADHMNRFIAGFVSPATWIFAGLDSSERDSRSPYH
jgi:hypothetical protein